MKSTRAVSAAIIGFMLSLGSAQNVAAQAKQVVDIPQPGVPEVLTIEGRFVRAAYNNEAYVILGYQVTNYSVGDKWMLLDFGVTLRDKTPAYNLTRAAISIDTPDGKRIPLPTVPEKRAANTQAIEQRATVQRDSINYFPPSATRACALLFFPDLASRALPYDSTELTSDRACVGRLFFPVPTGITYGQHWLNVKFQNSLLRVPFRVLTKDEEKFLSKNFKSIEQQVKEEFSPKK